jgi:hypothetical protein
MTQEPQRAMSRCFALREIDETDALLMDVEPVGQLVLDRDCNLHGLTNGCVCELILGEFESIFKLCASFHLYDTTDLLQRLRHAEDEVE